MISNELKICKGFGKQDPYSLYVFFPNELFLLLMIYVLMIMLQL